MADTSSRLARMIAAVPIARGADVYPMPTSPGVSLDGVSFAPPGQAMNRYAPMGNPLPPFGQPGSMMPPFTNTPRPVAPPPAAVPSFAPPSPPAPPPMAGGQGFGGPEPMGLPPQQTAEIDPRYLPEQWRGAFNPRWQG